LNVTVIAPGTTVLLGPHGDITGPIVGRIDKVQLGVGLVPRYFVSWWDGRTLQTSEFDAGEFRVDGRIPENTVRIGFATTPERRTVGPLTEGTERKGGQNPPNTSVGRPPPPQGSGGKEHQ
jgi:hypothetical protein